MGEIELLRLRRRRSRERSREQVQMVGDDVLKAAANSSVVAASLACLWRRCQLRAGVTVLVSTWWLDVWLLGVSTAVTYSQS